MFTLVEFRAARNNFMIQALKINAEMPKEWSYTSRT